MNPNWKRTLAMVLLAFASRFGATGQSAPFAHTLAPGPLNSTNATFTGAVVPNNSATSVWFQWGTNYSFDHSTAILSGGSSTGIRFVRSTVSSLTPNTTYQCRLVASNAVGVVLSHPQVFSTGGKLAAWGNPYYGNTSVLKGVSNVVAVAGGIASMNLALQADQRILVLPGDSSRSDVPAAATNIAALATASGYCLVLRSNGTLVGWPDFYLPAPISTASGRMAVAAGWQHFMGLGTDGRVSAAGDNSAGQSTVPFSLFDVVAIAAGYEHSLALKADGRVVAWGDNTYGQTAVPASLSNVVAIAAGFWHSFALRSDGTVVTWGSDYYNHGYLQVPPGLSNVVAIAAGKYHNLALKTDGTVVAWGGDESGQATVPPSLAGVAAVRGNEAHSIALAPNIPPQTVSVDVSGPANQDLAFAFKAFDINFDDLTLRIASFPAAGNLYQFTTNGRGALILPTDPSITDPEGRVIYVPPVDAFGEALAMIGFVANDGEVDSPLGVLTLNITGRPAAAAHQPGPITLDSARLRALVLPNGLPTTAWFEWGTNGTFTQTTIAEDAGNGTQVRPVFAALTNLVSGGMYSFRLAASNLAGVVRSAERRFRTGGRVVAWGQNNYGQSTPPAGLTNIVAIGAGTSHSLALRTDGTLAAWGDNSNGQTNLPPLPADLIALFGGYSSSAALGANGVIHSWTNGQSYTNFLNTLTNVFESASGWTSTALLADGTVVVPYGGAALTNVPLGLSNVLDVSAGAGFVAALRSDGTVMAWGVGSNGETNVPKGLSNVVEIASGLYHTLARHADGRVTAWGYNASGQTNVPASLSNAIAISAGEYHSLALTLAGTVVVWGRTNEGQANVPPGLGNVSALAAGGFHSLALGTNLPPTADPQVAFGIANHDLALKLTGRDVNGDLLGYRVTTLPAKGQLFQFDSGLRGPPINSPETAITDPSGRLIFAPATNDEGTNYAQIGFIANDGELDSPPAGITINIIGTTYAHTRPPIIRRSSVTLNGVVFPNGYATDVWFEWATNGQPFQATLEQAVGSGGAPVYVSALLTNLASVGAYRCRLVASNATGVVHGAEQLFTTRGKLVAWGRGGDNVALLPLPSLDRVVSVAAGPTHAMALNRDGTVVAFPMDYLGQSSILTNVPASLTNAVAVAAGAMHSLALKTDGRVSAWGNNNYNQTNVPSNLTNAVAIAAGSTYSLALLSNGTLRAWGSASPNYGQTAIPAGLSNVVAVAAGNDHNLALRNDGIVIAWGHNISGSTNVPPWLSNVAAIAAGDRHSLALRRDGSVVAWGDNWAGQTNVPAGLSNVVAIAGRSDHSLALRDDGTVIGWGLAPGRIVPTNQPAAIAIAADSNFGLAVVPVLNVLPYSATQPATLIAVSGAMLNGVVSPRDEPAVAWFEWGTLGALDRSTTLQYLNATNPIVRIREPVSNLVAHGAYQFRLVVSNAFGVAYGGLEFFSTGGRIAAWGSTNQGQTKVPRGLTNAIAIAGGLDFSLAVRLDGSVVGWGPNLHGVTNPPAGLSNVIAVAAGNNHSLALKADGRIVAWGNNSSGQTNVPASLTNAIAVRAGSLYSIALQADGRVAAWGNNSSGQTNIPGGLGDVVAIASGFSHNLALRSDGAVVAWGNSASTNVPATVSNIVAVAAGNSHSLALNGAGRVFAWGNNTYGQTNVPSGLSNVVGIASGGDHSLAMQEDGAIVMWGRNTSGQLATPPGLTNVTQLAGGGAHSLILADNAPPQALSRTQSGSANSDLVLLLLGSDANNDAITLRLAAEPALGRLYQYSAGLRGATMTSGTTVNDPAGRIIFAPGANGYGSPYTNLTYVANDGEADSWPAKVTVNIFPPITPTITASTRVTNGAFQLTFQGHTRTTYCVWASTNLANWEYLGFPNQPAAGDFLFVDAAAANLPQRFYRISTGCGPPAPALARDSGLTNGSFGLRFTGGPYWTYRVWASTNLVNWELLGAAEEAAPGSFRLLDSAATNFPQRFYKAGAP